MEDNKSTNPLSEDNISSPDQNATLGNSQPTLTDKPAGKRSKQLFITVTAVLVVAVSATLGWWLLGRGKDAPKTTNNNQSSQSTTPKQTATTASSPFAVAYAYTPQDKAPVKENACITSTSTLYWRPLSGGDRTQATVLGKNDYISDSGVYKNQVFIATTPGCGSTDGASVWFSNDSGATYSRVFIGKSGQNSAGIGEQITSAKFSNDGKTILIALLPSTDGAKNTIKEVNPVTKETHDVFSASNRGVFLEAYDTAKQQIYYFEGCYNCDGNQFNKLLKHDVAKNTESTVFEDTKLIGVGTYPNSNVSKFLLIKGTEASELMGAGRPYTIQELDTTTNAIKTLKTIDNDTFMGWGGYRNGDDTPYYIDGNSVFSLDTNGKTQTLYEASKKISSVPFLSKDLVVVATGEYDNYELNAYTFASKATVHLLSGDSYTNIFGVTWK